MRVRDLHPRSQMLRLGTFLFRHMYICYGYSNSFGIDGFLGRQDLVTSFTCR